MLFKSIIGNDHVKVYLDRMSKSKNIPNTILFSGPDGIGKGLFAKEFSNKLMYPNGTTKEISDKINNNHHPDLQVFYPEGKTGNHNIATIRELINQVYTRPFEADSKVIILHDAERMLPTSSNAILKTLEEPNLSCYIILITSKPEDILPTILSRCMKVMFASVAETSIVDFLQDNYKKTNAEAKQIAALSYGSVRRAIDLAHFPQFNEKRRILIEILSKKDLLTYSELLDLLIKLEDETSIQEGDGYNFYNYQYIDFIFSQILMWYRDLHLLKKQADPKHLFFSDSINLLKEQNFSDLPSLEDVHNEINISKDSIKRNIKLRVCLEKFLFEMSK